MRDYDLLSAYAPVTPTALESETVRAVRAFVTVAVGVRDFPRFTLSWYRAAPDLPDGITHAAGQQQPVVLLRQGMPRHRLVKVALHEMAHVLDSRTPNLFVDEREARAEAFTVRWADRACRAVGVR